MTCAKCNAEIRAGEFCLDCELEAVYQHGKAHAEARAEIEERRTV
jgi:hypothetical protein